MTLHCVVCWCSSYFKCSFWSIWDLSSRIFLWIAIIISMHNTIGRAQKHINILKFVKHTSTTQATRKKIKHPQKKYNALFNFFICSCGSMFTGLTSMILGISILVPQDGHWVCCPRHSSWASRVLSHCGQLKVKFAMVVSWFCLSVSLGSVEIRDHKKEVHLWSIHPYMPTTASIRIQTKKCTVQKTRHNFSASDWSGLFTRW